MTHKIINKLVSHGRDVNRALLINWPFTNENIVAANLHANRYFEYGLFALSRPNCQNFRMLMSNFRRIVSDNI